MFIETPVKNKNLIDIKDLGLFICLHLLFIVNQTRNY